MYAKLVVFDDNDRLHGGRAVSGNDGERKREVAPRMSEIFEGYRFTYRKIRIDNQEQLENVLTNLGGTTFTAGIEKIENDSVELIVFTTYTASGDFADGKPCSNYVAGANSVLYIMNELGDTIDSVRCRNRIMGST